MAKVGSGGQAAIIACGPGYRMDLATGLGTKPLGINFSELMLTTARHKFPGHKFEQGATENLVHEANSFDANVCPFGVLHPAYPNKVLSGFFRVLKPGGRMVYSVWTSLEQNPFSNMAMSTIAKYGTLDVGMPPGPQMFDYADETRAHRELTDIGFIDIKVNAFPLIGRSDVSQFLVDSSKHSTVQTKMALATQTPEAFEAIFLDLRHQTQP